jgi:hypothetical protein
MQLLKPETPKKGARKESTESFTSFLKPQAKKRKFANAFLRESVEGTEHGSQILKPADESGFSGGI